MKIGIGIDTGGTYTDAVLYDFHSRTVVAKAKALTTRENLAVGIEAAMSSLPQGQLVKAEIVGLSTTLATNACVENKGGRARLMFWGVDRKVGGIHWARYGLPDMETIVFQEQGAHFDGQLDEEPDWKAFGENLHEWFDGYDAAAIVEINAMKDNAAIEKKAKQLVEAALEIPVVCGHELFSDLNSIQRGASTLLNARLIPVIADFLEAVKRVLKQKGIAVPIVIVRSDGSLMNEEFTAVRPVETLLCGPAASVMGGVELTSEPNSLIVDMGGTTTDIAFVKDKIPVRAEDGIRVGKWRTFVKGLYVDTFSLGGDTAVRYNDRQLLLDSVRVVPLCMLAAQYPNVTEKLRDIVEQERIHTKYIHEFYLRLKDISHSDRYSDREKDFCQALENGPLTLEEAATAMGKDVYTLNVMRLEKEGVVIRSGLTPTDIMHIKGDFQRYDAEASKLGARQVALCVGMDLDTLCDRVYEEIHWQLYRNIARILLEDRNPYYKKHGLDAGMEVFLRDCFEGREGTLLNSILTTPAALIGVGAPTHIFLPKVAELLGTRAVIPPHAEVANAVGAVVGNIVASCTIEIRPECNEDGVEGFCVYGTDQNVYFQEAEEARSFAAAQATEAAKQEARRRGATGELTIRQGVEEDVAEARDMHVYLGTRVTVTAVGKLGDL